LPGDRPPCRAPQAPAVLVEQHRAASGGEHRAFLRSQLGEHLRLAAAEAGFALDLQIRGIFTPQRRSISWSESTKRSFRRRASSLPTVVLPAPSAPRDRCFRRASSPAL